MKINYLCLVTFLVFTITFYGQEEVLSFKLDTKNTKTQKTTYSMPDEIANRLALFIEDRKQIHAQLFDANFSKLSQFVFETPKRKYSQLLGYTINNKVYNLFYANDRLTQFLVVSANFSLKNVTSTELDFDLDDELYIDSVVHNNTLFFLTSDDKSIIIRELTNNKTLKKVKTFNINEATDANILYSNRTDFWGFFATSLRESNVTKIDHRVPTAIEQTSKSNKLYKYEDKLILALEDDENGTLVYNIDLNTLDITSKSYAYAKGKIDDFKKYNSFIYDEKIFQIASSRKEMNFSIKSLDGKLLKEFYLTKEDSIYFKNGPIIQEGATVIPFQNKRKLEATSKYLRKISSGYIGISVIKVNQLYEITLGGYKQMQSAGVGFGAGFGAAPGINIGGGFAFVPVFNPTFYNYSNFANTKATFFDTVLNTNFEPVKKEFEPSIYDRIDDFMVDYKGVTAEDLFFYNNTSFHGYFDQRDGYFHLVKF